MVESRRMLNDLDQTIQKIIVNASSEMAQQIARAVRAALAAEIIGPERSRIARPVAAQPAKAATASTARAARAKPQRNVKRRTSDRVAKDDARILAWVKSNPGQGSIAIGKGVGLPKQHVSSGLERLRENGKVKIKGLRSAATYTAA
jgi:hypothetical protein